MMNLVYNRRAYLIGQINLSAYKTEILENSKKRQNGFVSLLKMCCTVY